MHHIQSCWISSQSKGGRIPSDSEDSRIFAVILMYKWFCLQHSYSSSSQVDMQWRHYRSSSPRDLSLYFFFLFRLDMFCKSVQIVYLFNWPLDYDQTLPSLLLFFHHCLKELLLPLRIYSSPDGFKQVDENFQEGNLDDKYPSLLRTYRTHSQKQTHTSRNVWQ